MIANHSETGSDREGSISWGEKNYTDKEEQHLTFHWFSHLWWWDRLKISSAWTSTYVTLSASALSSCNGWLVVIYYCRWHRRMLVCYLLCVSRLSSLFLLLPLPLLLPFLLFLPRDFEVFFLFKAGGGYGGRGGGWGKNLLSKIKTLLLFILSNGHYRKLYQNKLHSECHKHRNSIKSHLTKPRKNVFYDEGT